MEAADPPFSAHAVSTLSLQTDVGVATVKQVCAVFGISRQAYYAAKQAQDEKEPPPRRGGARAPAVAVEVLLEAIIEIVDAQPAWGIRKVWATLRRAPYALRVSQKRVWALMKANGLTLPFAGPRDPEPRRGQVAVEEPNRLWATDMTTVQTKEDGTVAVTIVVDCGCRSGLELSVSKSQDAVTILAPTRSALESQFGCVSEVPDGLELRSDHGPQFTGSDCEEMCRDWRLQHTFAPVGRPTGNAVAERLIRTMKEECIWLRDWRNLAELEEALRQWLRAYNEQRPHQALGWATPAERRAERFSVLQEAA